MQKVFEALASAPRRKILAFLAEAELNAGEIASRFAMSKPAVSQHLAVLRGVGLVSEQRHGRERRYHLHPERLDEVRKWMHTLDRFWGDRLDRLGRHLEENP